MELEGYWTDSLIMTNILNVLHDIIKIGTFIMKMGALWGVASVITVNYH